MSPTTPALGGIGTLAGFKMGVFSPSMAGTPFAVEARR